MEQTLNFLKMNSKVINWNEKLNEANVNKAREKGIYVKYPKGSSVVITGAAAQWAGKGKGTDPTMTYSTKYRIAAPLQTLQAAMAANQLPRDLLANAYTLDSAGPSGLLSSAYQAEIMTRKAELESGQNTSFFSLRDVPGILAASKDPKNWEIKDKKTKKAGGASGAARRGNIVPLNLKLAGLAEGKIIKVSQLDKDGKGARVVDLAANSKSLKRVDGLRITSNNMEGFNNALDQLVKQGSITLPNADEFRRRFSIQLTGAIGPASPYASGTSSPGYASPASPYSRNVSPAALAIGSPRTIGE